MQELIETLASFGVTIPEEKKTDIKSALSRHYKNNLEVTKTLGKIEADRDKWKAQAEEAAKTLETFDGIDPKEIKGELEEWKKKAAEAETNAQKQIYERDFADALKTEMEAYKFTSEAAKRDVMGQIKAADLKLKDGKILGLSDLVNQIKEADASAFVDEDQQKLENGKARFTTQHKTGNGTGKKLSEMTLDERMKLKAENPDLYDALHNG